MNSSHALGGRLIGSCLRVSLLFGCFLLAGLQGFAEQPRDPFVRSTVLMAKYKDQMRVVIGVKGGSPQVMVGDKAVSLPDDVGFLPFRGKQRVNAYVDVLDQHAESYQVNQIMYFQGGGEVDNGPISRGSSYDCYLVSDKRIEDCYLVLLFVDRDFLMGHSNELKCSVLFHKVGTLKAGEKKKQSISFGYLDEEHRRSTVYCPMLFSRGVEVKTAMSFRSDQILARIETLQHANIVRTFLEKNNGQDQKVRLYQQGVMTLPADTDFAALPDAVSAVFTVDTDGIPQAVQIKGELPEVVRWALVRNIQNWLFMPAVEKGYPKATVVQVPISLKEPAAESK